MKGLGRNLIYWGITLEKQLLLILGVIGVGAGMFVFMEGGNFLIKMADMLPFYIFMVTFIIVFINALVGLSGNYALSISLGSNRKSSFIARQIVQHGVMVEMAVIAVFFLQWSQNKEMEQMISTYPLSFIGVGFLIQGIGNLVSVIRERFGAIAGFTVYILCMMIIIAATVYMTVTVAQGTGIIEKIREVFAGPWLFVIGLVVDAVMIFGFYRISRKVDLKFS